MSNPLITESNKLIVNDHGISTTLFLAAVGESMVNNLIANPVKMSHDTMLSILTEEEPNEIESKALSEEELDDVSSLSSSEKPVYYTKEYVRDYYLRNRKTMLDRSNKKYHESKELYKKYMEQNPGETLCDICDIKILNIDSGVHKYSLKHQKNLVRLNIKKGRVTPNPLNPKDKKNPTVPCACGKTYKYYQRHHHFMTKQHMEHFSIGE